MLTQYRSEKTINSYPDCEGWIPTGYSYFRHHFKKLYIFLVMILFLVYFNFDE